MKITKIFFLLAILFTAQSTFANISRPGEKGQPTTVYSTIYFLDIDSVDTAEQSFVANVYFIFRWHDPRLAHEGPGSIIRPLREVWNPRIQFGNQQKVFKTLPEEVSISPEGEVKYLQRVWGSFSQPLKLESYPFDRQSLSVQVMGVQQTPDEIQLVPDPEKPSGIAKEVSVTDWEITGWKTDTKPFQPSPDSIPISAFTLSIDAKRRIDYFVVNIIIPLFLIVAMSWVVFWIEPKESSGTKISIAATGMLTLIAYRFAIGTSLPKLSYLTRLDEFILWSTILVFGTLVQTVFTSYYTSNGKIDLTIKIDKWSRWIFPAMLILVAFLSLGLG